MQMHDPFATTGFQAPFQVPDVSTYPFAAPAAFQWPAQAGPGIQAAWPQVTAWADPDWGATLADDWDWEWAEAGSLDGNPDGRRFFRRPRFRRPFAFRPFGKFPFFAKLGKPFGKFGKPFRRRRW